MIVSSARFDLVSPDGRKLGHATIAVLPSRANAHGLPALVDERASQFEQPGIEPVQLLEGCEYVYEIASDAPITIDKSDLFIADDESGKRGRLRTRLSTGLVEVRVCLGGVMALPFAVEVRSTKLGYLDDYRCMLENIAEVGAELLLERFAPSEQRLAVDVNLDARTIYQRFVFLRGLLQSERLSAALRRVVTTPYVQWKRMDEQISPGRGMRGSGVLAYELSRGGPRVEWPSSPYSAMRTVPQHMHAPRTEETLDNVPNRFVRFALEEWRGLVANLLDVLERDRRASPNRVSAPVARGLFEGNALAAYLDDLIRAPVFEDVSRLSEFPLANQVLQKKEGYRDILHAYLLVQLGAQLEWAGGEDVFGGGQRNVATLYEYWVFLQLALIISPLCSEPLDLRTLVTESSSGLNLVLRRAQAHAIAGSFRRKGRSFRIRLCFNQQFSQDTNGTWTKSLRPDCSLHIKPLEPERERDDVWLHFDAKYRVNHVEDLLRHDDESDVKADDIDKMHTYRDAILGAVGAYVVFPGREELTRKQFQEILPGLGAFPLRPSRNGAAKGMAAIERFLDQVFDHVATQTTQHERVRFWQREATREPSVCDAGDSVPFLRFPPADTPVLLGYVKGAGHHAWIVQNDLYNLRAESSRRGGVGLRGAELSAEIVVLYGAIGVGATLFHVVAEPRLMTRQDLLEIGYPEPQGQVYFCLKLQEIAALPSWWSADRIQKVVQRHRGTRVPAAPMVVSWHELTKP